MSCRLSVLQTCRACSVPDAASLRCVQCVSLETQEEVTSTCTEEAASQLPLPPQPQTDQPHLGTDSHITIVIDSIECNVAESGCGDGQCVVSERPTVDGVHVQSTFTEPPHHGHSTSSWMENSDNACPPESVSSSHSETCTIGRSNDSSKNSSPMSKSHCTEVLSVGESVRDASMVPLSKYRFGYSAHLALQRPDAHLAAAVTKGEPDPGGQRAPRASDVWVLGESRGGALSATSAPIAPSSISWSVVAPPASTLTSAASFQQGDHVVSAKVEKLSDPCYQYCVPVSSNYVPFNQQRTPLIFTSHQYQDKY